jgi:hypothetical protein
MFQIVRTEKFHMIGTKVYSSKTGEWSYKEGGWNHSEVIFSRRHVFHHGMMHYIYSSAIVAVDTEGKTGQLHCQITRDPLTSLVMLTSPNGIYTTCRIEGWFTMF